MEKKRKICFLLMAAVSHCCFSAAQVRPDSVLRAHAEKWTGTQHKEAFTFGKPSFGLFTTYSITKIDTPEINRQSTAARNSGIELSGGKTTFDQTKTIDREKTTWYRLLLGNGTDTITAKFALTIITRKEKRTLLGFIFGKTDSDSNHDFFYNRDVKGSIHVPADSLVWDFSLSSYADRRIGSGYLKHEQDSLIVQTYNASGFSAEIILAAADGSHVASVFFNMNEIEIYVRKDLDESYRQAIACLFAVIVSIKN